MGNFVDDFIPMRKPNLFGCIACIQDNTSTEINADLFGFFEKTQKTPICLISLKRICRYCLILENKIKSTVLLYAYERNM
jgi:hypothetical protein